MELALSALATATADTAVAGDMVIATLAASTLLLVSPMDTVLALAVLAPGVDTALEVSPYTQVLALVLTRSCISKESGPFDKT